MGNIIRRLGKWVIRQNLRIERGSGWFNRIGKPITMIATVGILNETIFVRYFNYSLPILFYPIFVGVALNMFWITTKFDEKFHLWEYEHKLMSSRYNPHFREIYDDIKLIKKKMNIIEVKE